MWNFLHSQISRNFAKNGVKSFAFRENLKTQKYSHSNDDNESEFGDIEDLDDEYEPQR